MALNISLSPYEKRKFSVWNDPVGDKYRKIWRVMQDTKMPGSMQEAVERIRESTPDNGYAVLRDGPELRYWELKSCDLKTIGGDFALRSRALLIQEGSPLKAQLDDA